MESTTSYSIQKECLGDFKEKKVIDRRCTTCSSLSLCIQEKSTNIKKHYIRLENIENTHIKDELTKMKHILENNEYKSGRYQTVWTMLKLICRDKNITPNDITIIDIADYIQNANFSESSLQPTISILRKFAKDILQLNNWNILGKGNQSQKDRSYYKLTEFVKSDLYKNYDKFWTRYTTLRKCQTYSGTFVYQRKFLDYCFKQGVIDFKLESLKPHIEDFLAEQEVRSSSYSQIWSSLRTLFESAFSYTHYKYDIAKPKKSQPRLKKLPTQEEIDFLFKYLHTDKDIRWYPLIASICYSSVRIDQLCSLTWDTIDLEQRFFRLSMTKTGDRDKIIVKNLIPLLKEYKKKHSRKYRDTSYIFPLNKDKDKHITSQMVREKLRELARKLNIGYYPPNNWRAFICITIWINSGYNYEYARKFMDHDSVKTTEQYIKHYRNITQEINFEEYIIDYIGEHDTLLTNNDGKII